MRYADTLELDDASFRRRTGIKKTTFRKKLEVLTEQGNRIQSVSGIY